MNPPEIAFGPVTDSGSKYDPQRAQAVYENGELVGCLVLKRVPLNCITPEPERVIYFVELCEPREPETPASRPKTRKPRKGPK